jgi:hypothetical protein
MGFSPTSEKTAPLSWAIHPFRTTIGAQIITKNLYRIKRKQKVFLKFSENRSAFSANGLPFRQKSIHFRKNNTANGNTCLLHLLLTFSRKKPRFFPAIRGIPREIVGGFRFVGKRPQKWGESGEKIPDKGKYPQSTCDRHRGFPNSVFLPHVEAQKMFIKKTICSRKV